MKKIIFFNTTNLGSRYLRENMNMTLIHPSNLEYPLIPLSTIKLHLNQIGLQI